ncbi:MAG: YHS domain-containing protein [Crenarchaeota archaeon]|nr:YHS domain-containing protein [Thermoproteota archaeon]
MMKKIDPVCGMEVETTTQYKTVYKGQVYYFCSRQCLEAFRKNPDYYLEHGPQGMPGETHSHEEHEHEHHHSAHGHHCH